MSVCKDDRLWLPMVYQSCEAVNDGNELHGKRKQNIAAPAYEQNKWRE
jgi:hypothetical protein